MRLLIAAHCINCIPHGRDDARGDAILVTAGHQTKTIIVKRIFTMAANLSKS